VIKISVIFLCYIVWCFSCSKEFISTRVRRNGRW